MGGEAGLWKLPGGADPAGRHKQLLTIDDMALLGFAHTAGDNRAAKQSGAVALMRPALARRLLLMTLLLVSLTLFATTLGAMRLPLVNLLPSGDDMLRHIWLTIRLPRVLLALVGAALALSGCVMQGLFRNPLADPGLLGISSGAALAVASWLVLPFSAAGLIALYMPMLAAFIGSPAVMVVIFILSRAEEGSLSRLLLVGIAINALCGALVGVLSG